MSTPTLSSTTSISPFPTSPPSEIHSQTTTPTRHTTTLQDLPEDPQQQQQHSEQNSISISSQTNKQQQPVSLRQAQQTIDTLQKENFELKLRIFFSEQHVQYADEFSEVQRKIQKAEENEKEAREMRYIVENIKRQMEHVESQNMELRRQVVEEEEMKMHIEHLDHSLADMVSSQITRRKGHHSSSWRDRGLAKFAQSRYSILHPTSSHLYQHVKGQH